MAVPTITNVDPSVGPAHGGGVVEITGTGFRLPVSPPLGEPSSESPTPTVQVLFGTTEALEAYALSATLVHARPPVLWPDKHDVTVRNLDDNGDPIVGETVTASSAYATKQPALTHESESDLTRLVRQLLRELKRQVVSEVSLTVHTDYDEATGDALHTTKLASLPGLVLVGPDLEENRFFSLNEPQQIEDPNDPDVDFVITAVPYTVDLQFDLIGVSNLAHELLNLMSAVLKFFHSNKYLSLRRDPSDPSRGSVSYEMDWIDRPTTSSRLNLSNVRHFTSRFVVRGFDLEAQAGIESGTAANVPKHEILRHGKTLEDEVEIEATQQTGLPSPVVRSIKSGQNL